MSPAMKNEYVRAIRERYKKSSKKGKTKILDEFCEVSGLHRKSAIRRLTKATRYPRKKAGPKATYGAEELVVIKTIWLHAEQICSKRLKPALPLWLPYYEQKHGELEETVRAKVLKLSPATIDRMLAPIRARLKPKGWCGTKPGSLLRNQIPISTNHWDVTSPGFLEVDTVAHGGETSKGDYIWSITFTDIDSGWTENRATFNKGSAGIIVQIKDVEANLAFPMLGFDCDNGSEFINQHLLRYFSNHKTPVSFTRSRPYRKNDNAHVEQKNYTHVRQLLGYDRLSNPALVPIINSLYKEEWSQLQNFFCPSFKLLRKERFKSKTRKVYETPKTPYVRLLESSALSEASKDELRERFESLDPFKLKKGVEKKLKKILNTR